MRNFIYLSAALIISACTSTTEIKAPISSRSASGGIGDDRRGDELAQACPAERKRAIIPISRERSVYTGMDAGTVLVEFNGRCNKLPLRSKTISGRRVIANRGCLKPFDEPTTDGVGRLVPSGEPELGVCGVNAIYQWKGEPPFPGDNG